ncbi:MAG: GIY-YIG nuclease family protein [Lachnospiraceae bacterium]|nr:GIY-YIG nuclease family protein [Lachnospiraceae bacterium]
MAYGKSIELFLVNGTADSLITVELSNWNGKALKIPRIEVSSCDRDDFMQPGVYFLFCKEDDGSDSVYIGEAENVKERLLQHLRDYQSEKEKYYWNTAVVFVGRDLNKAHIRYLENRFVEIARNSKRYLVLTKNTYSHTVLKESQIAVMDEFIDNVKVLINALGYKVLEPIPGKSEQEKSAAENPDKETIMLHLERSIKNVGKVEADGSQTSEGFVVFQGSQISLKDDNTIPAVIKERRKSAPIDENGVLQENMLFTSPSYAAMFVIGKSANGLTSWKTSEGKTLKSLENEE